MAHPRSSGPGTGPGQPGGNGPGGQGGWGAPYGPPQGDPYGPPPQNPGPYPGPYPTPIPNQPYPYGPQPTRPAARRGGGCLTFMVFGPWGWILRSANRAAVRSLTRNLIRAFHLLSRRPNRL